MNDNVINNVELYMNLLFSSEKAARFGMAAEEASILEEMNELWKEMTSAERDEVDKMLGYNFYA